MITTRFFVPQWGIGDLGRIVLPAAQIIVYGARGELEMTDEQSEEVIEPRWPGIIPSGASVTTGEDGMVWVTSGSFIRG